MQKKIVTTVTPREFKVNIFDIDDFFQKHLKDVDISFKKTSGMMENGENSQRIVEKTEITVVKITNPNVTPFRKLNQKIVIGPKENKNININSPIMKKISNFNSNNRSTPFSSPILKVNVKEKNDRNNEEKVIEDYGYLYSQFMNGKIDTLISDSSDFDTNLDSNLIPTQILGKTRSNDSSPMNMNRPQFYKHKKMKKVKVKKKKKKKKKNKKIPVFKEKFIKKYQRESQQQQQQQQQQQKLNVPPPPPIHEHPDYHFLPSLPTYDVTNNFSPQKPNTPPASSFQNSRFQFQQQQQQQQRNQYHVQQQQQPFEKYENEHRMGGYHRQNYDFYQDNY